MTGGSRAALERRIGDLREQAAALAAREQARPPMTTLAVERATLRFLGVHGLDGEGHPLAASVVERLSGGGAPELGGGIALPLAAAAAARGMGAQEAALEVARGDIDLAVESQFLQHPDRRASAEGLLGAWSAEATERVDANRTARHEVSDALGVPDQPWLGARIGAFPVDMAIDEARRFVAAGADALVVRVPRSRELALGATDAGDPRPAEMDPPPAGSQRGLSAMRAVLDEIAAERGAYVALATITDGLTAPEQAVVAAFERIDLVFADPFDEIVLGIDPQRALVDHAAAAQLLASSGATLVLGPGALLAGPELARAEALAARTRIGRSIAAQAMSAAWAATAGLPAGRVLLQAPFEGPTDAAAGALLLAEITIRRMLHPDHALVITEPAGGVPDAWRLTLPLCLLAAGESRLVLQESPAEDFPARADAARAGATLARVLAEGLAPGSVGTPLPLADEVVAAAMELAAIAAETLELAASEGWAPLVGSGAALAEADPARLGRAGLVPAPVYAGPLGVGSSVEGG